METIYPIALEGADRAQMRCVPQGLRRKVLNNREARRFKAEFPEYFLQNGDMVLELAPGTPAHVLTWAEENTEVIKTKKNRVTFMEKS